MTFFQKAIFIFFLLTSSASFGQINLKAIRFSLFSEAVSLPTYELVKIPIHPGILIGADMWKKEGEYWHQSFGGDISYYYHRTFEHSILLDAVYSIGYAFKFGLQPKLLSSLGYKHSILTGNQFKFENGKYKKSANIGKAQLNIKLGIGLEYAISDIYAINLDYRIMVAYPYSPNKNIPLAPYSLFGIGIIIKTK